jgi:DNA-binding winged helix-turn-helix (wHTH) protein
MPHSNNLCYEFGPYILNMVQRVLTRSGETISLTPKATDLLALLVENAGQLVEKEVLLREIWPNTFVEEGNVTQAIFQLRRALGDNRSNPKYIETVTRRGYRFIAPISPINNPPNKRVNLGRQFSSFDQSVACPVLAVMPFINSTENESFEFLASGITDSIINSLSRLSKLRVMSRNTVLRFRETPMDPQLVGRELGVDAVLLGQITPRGQGFQIHTELVDAGTGWQLWGQAYDYELSDVFEIQDEITTQLVSALRLALTGEERRRVTARHTENAEAYHSYLEGRHFWSRYTRQGIEKAISCFKNAIELDPNYALAYAGVVDCYLRLATSYLPTDSISEESDRVLHPTSTVIPSPSAEAIISPEGPIIELRYEWDWKGAEREIRRANDLKSEYPSAHQWRAVYNFCVTLLKEAMNDGRDDASKLSKTHEQQPASVGIGILTPNEQVQILCTVAREQLEAGNYEAGRLLLRKWWSEGEWPNLRGLNSYSAGDLLFTTGMLAGCLSSTGRMPRGQKLAEALLSGSLGIFDHLGSRRAAHESRIELALCYYRQGAFDLARDTSLKVLEELVEEDYELRGIALLRLAVLERHAGRLDDALSRLSEAATLLELCGPMATGRYYIELASTIKNQRQTHGNGQGFDDVIELFQKAFHDFEAIGHHRYVAVVQNNLGYLLLDINRFPEAQSHLLHARHLFEEFDDKLRRAQVDDTLAQLYLGTDSLETALSSVERAVATLEKNDEDALLAEALTTKGLVLSRLKRRGEAKSVLEGAYRIADRCGDPEGSGRALLVIVEELNEDLNEVERSELNLKLTLLLENSQQFSTRERLMNCLKLLK